MAMRQTRRANQTLPTHRRFGGILSRWSCIFQPLVIAVGLETRWHGVSRVAPSTSQRRSQLHPSFLSWSCSLGLSPSPPGTWFLPQPKLNLHLLPFSPIGLPHRSCTPCGRKPPSLCIPPTKNETMLPGSTTEPVKRGLSFSPGEDLALARSFASTTLSTTDMTSDLYWEAVADIYKNQAETRIPRTAKSLLNRFTTLQRVVQKYLAASSAYLPHSGQVESDRLSEVMTLYRNTNKVQNTKGDLVPAPVFKSTDAAVLLSQCPKFLSMIGGPSATSRGYRPSPHRERDARLTAAHAGGMVAGAAGAAAVDAAPAAAAVAVLNAGRATASVLCATSGAVGGRREVAGATSADGAGAAECLLDAGEGAGRDCRRESDNADPESPTIAAAVPSLRPSAVLPSRFFGYFQAI